MSEPAEWFDVLRQARKDRRDKRIPKNIEAIKASGIPHEERPNALLFRELGKPKVDFFPGTGRWRSKNRTYRGGAKAFLSWYRKQERSE